MQTSEFVWDNIWRNDAYATPAERLRRAVRRATEFRSMLGEDQVLGAVTELGCGDGSLASVLLSDSRWQVTSYLGIDRSPTAVVRAKEKLRHTQLAEIRQDDVESLSIQPRLADTVIACGLLEHIADVNRALELTSAICSSAGQLMLTMSNTLSMMYVARLCRQFSGRWPYGYQKNYTPAELGKLLDNHFVIRAMKVVHGDWDFPFSAIGDRLGSAFNRRVGRYIYAVAQKREKKA